MPFCNSTLEDQRDTVEPVWHGYTFHQFGLGLGAIFALIATIVSFYLIIQHALHYSKPTEQRHIIRILFMVPIYAVVSYLSYFYYYHALYFEVLRDCYEAFAIASFFALLCHYVAPTLHDQKEYFRNATPEPWPWPANWVAKCTGGQRGPFRTPRNGLTWFNIIWLGVFQYCFIRVATTVIAVISQSFGRYCLSSLNPAFAHVWLSVIDALAVTFAMFFLIAFYITLKTDLANHKPFFKLLCIKLVIFFSFWQTLIINYLVSSNRLKSTAKIGHADLAVGLPSLLICVEMAIFAILHIFAFSHKEYRINKYPNTESPERYQGGFLGIKAIIDCFNIWDLVKAFGRGVRWLFVGRKTRNQEGQKLGPINPTPNTNFDDVLHEDTSYGSVSGKTARYQQLSDEEDHHFAGRMVPGNGRQETSDPYHSTRFNEETSYNSTPTSYQPQQGAPPRGPHPQPPGY